MGLPSAFRLVSLTAGLAFLAAYVEGFHRLCYWTVWSQGRPGDYGLSPGNIDPYLCTHLIYAFGFVGNDLNIDLAENDYPAARRSVKTFNDLKNTNRDLLTLISIGGISKGPEAFDLPSVDQTSRMTFANNVVRFCRQNNFDGIDIDWEYPKNKTIFTLLSQVNEFYETDRGSIYGLDLTNFICTSSIRYGSPEDKALRAAFDADSVPSGKRRLLLSAAVSVSGEKINTIYDIPALNSALDYFNVMAYDFHGSWGKISAFNSPLYARPSDPRIHTDFNADWAVKQYINKGASRSKIILGLASYGRAYKLTDRRQHDVGAPIEPSTKMGPVLQLNEQRMYPEVCDFYKEKRARYKFDEEQKSAFVYTIDFWIGYDNPRAFQAKTSYAMQQKLGGVLLWTLDYDDVSGNHCGLGRFPLAKAVKNTVEGNTQLIPQQPPGHYRPILDLPRPGETMDRYKRLCYFLNWSPMRQADKGQFTLSDVNLNICTHLSYAHAFVDEVGYSILPISQADESKSSRDQGMMETFNNIKRANPALRTLLAVGGTAAGTRAFDIISKDDTTRRAFALNVIEYLEIWGFNGLELVWTYPGNPPATRHQFTQLLQVLREEFNKYERANSGVKLILCISVAGENPQIRNAYEIPQIARHADMVNVLTYTYHRKDNRTYFISPLRKSSTDLITQELNQEWSINEWINSGVPADKLLLGLTGMGRSFTLKSMSDPTPGALYTDRNVTGPILGIKGIMVQSEICDFLNRGATENYNSEQVAPYAYFNDLWVTFENRKSIKAKVDWVKSRGLGGYSFWTLDYDDFTGNHCSCGQFPILTAAYQAVKDQPVTCFGAETSPGNDGTQGLKPVTIPERPKPKTTTPPYRRNIIMTRDSSMTLSHSFAVLLIMVVLQRLCICK